MAGERSPLPFRISGKASYRCSLLRRVLRCCMRLAKQSHAALGKRRNKLGKVQWTKMKETCEEGRGEQI